jgi:hypothetical protein
MPFPRRTPEQVQGIIRDRSTAQPNGCWNWDGPCTPYGKFMWLGDQGAHRASARAFHLDGASIPSGHVVRHSCDNPSCVNPDHLSVGSYADNTRDMDDRGRRKQARGADLPQTKLSEGDVHAIRNGYANGDITQRQLAAQYGVSPSQISRCINHLRHAYVA